MCDINGNSEAYEENQLLFSSFIQSDILVVRCIDTV
jgi:hypothetical protein